MAQRPTSASAAAVLLFGVCIQRDVADILFVQKSSIACAKTPTGRDGSLKAQAPPSLQIERGASAGARQKKRIRSHRSVRSNIPLRP